MLHHLFGWELIASEKNIPKSAWFRNELDALMLMPAKDDVLSEKKTEKCVVEVTCINSDILEVLNNRVEEKLDKLWDGLMGGVPGATNGQLVVMTKLPIVVKLVEIF